MVGQGPTDGQSGLEAWRAAGTDEVMLPTGTEVRVFRPSLERLARENLLLGTLRLAALREDSPASSATAEDAPAREKAHQLAGEHVLGFRLPGTDEWLPTPPEIVAGDFEQLPPVDREALVQLMLHARTPRYIDTRNRLALGLITEEEAGTILSRESGGIASWAGFRAGRERVVGGADGADVRDIAERTVRRHGSRGGVSARRGDGDRPEAGAAQA